MPERIDLDSYVSGSRRKAIDAEWSKPKKIIVTSLAGVLATTGLAWGVWSFIESRPPSMPTTAEQAVLLLASDKFGDLDGERRAALRSEAVRLLIDATEEERDELRETIELSEEGRDQLREAFMEDMVRKFARGEDIDWSAMRGRRPGGNRPGGERPARGEGEGRPERGEGGRGGGGPGGEGGGGEGRNDRREQMRNRIQERMASGNAQTTALFGELWSRRRQQREQNGNNGRGGGGGG